MYRWQTHKENKRYHLIIWWRDPGTKEYTRVADGYSPKNTFGYAFKVFRDNKTGRVYFAMDAHGRLVLYGYDTFAKKLEMYVDSINYWSPLPLPSMLVRPDGDLELRFDDVKRAAEPTRYRLFWDAGRTLTFPCTMMFRLRMTIPYTIHPCMRLQPFMKV